MLTELTYGKADFAGRHTKVWLRLVGHYGQCAVKRTTVREWMLIQEGRAVLLRAGVFTVPILKTEVWDEEVVWAEPVCVPLDTSAAEHHHLVEGRRVAEVGFEAGVGDLRPCNVALCDGRVVVIDSGAVLTGGEPDTWAQEDVLGEWDELLEGEG